MKVCLFLTLVVAVVGLNANAVHLTDAQKAIANPIIAECAKESGVKQEVLAQAKEGKYIEDEGLKKFVYCFFQKAGIVSSDGKLDVDAAVSKLPPGADKAEARGVLEKCKNKTGKDSVDTAFSIFKCYHDGVHTHVLF